MCAARCRGAERYAWDPAGGVENGGVALNIAHLLAGHLFHLDDDWRRVGERQESVAPGLWKIAS